MSTGMLPGALALAMMVSTGAWAQDIAAGEGIYQNVCRNCHGPTAKGMASFPKLTGQGADYLVTRMQAYRAAEMVGPNSPLMYPIAADLSDDDMINIAGYIGTLE